MRIKTLALTLLPIISFAITGCKGGSDPNNYGALNRLNAYPSKIITEHAPAAAHYTEVITNADEAVSVDELVLEIKATHPFENQRDASAFRFHLFKQAVASSPLLPFEERRVYNLTITSDQDFSQSYPAGSVLNDLFIIEYLNTADGGASSQGSYAPELWTTHEDLYGQSLDDYLMGESFMVLHMQLRLTEAPTISTEHSFEIMLNIKPMKLATISIQP